MARALLSLALIALASTAALAKPKIAILGLEVTGMVDQAATTVARDLTEGMRQRAKVGGGTYTLAPNSDRELIDEKLIKQCDSEAPSCMAEIGKDIDTDVLVYGKLEKDGGGFQATIFMLDVRKRAPIKQTFVLVPPGASGDAVRGIAKKTYLELAPTATGSAKLVVTANVESGSVFVDDELRETLSEGRAMLTLPEGRHRIAIESEGYKRKEITVKLAEEDTATEAFALTRKAAGDEGGGIDPWKPIFGVTAVAAVLLGGYSTLKWLESRDPTPTAEESAFISSSEPSQDDCTDAVLANLDTLAAMGQPTPFRDSCKAYKTHVTFAIIGGSVGAVALIAGYFAFVHGDEKEPKRGDVAITPTLTPHGGGVTLNIEW